jgi:iron complex outermembrane receptor protein
MRRCWKKRVVAVVAGSLAATAALRAELTPPPTTRPANTSLQGANSTAATTQPITAGPAEPSVRPATMPHPGTHDLTDLSLEDLMNVEVTSVSKQPQRISDAPASVTVIGQNDIQRSGLNSIPELLRLAPGMDVARVNANQWAISARGFNGQLADDLLVLMDGRSIYNPTFGGVLWNTVDYPLSDLDRIEVIRGPGATLWGANAVNGVVNIITKPADQTQGLSLESRIGTDESDGSARYGGKIDDVTYFRGYVKYGYTGSYPASNGDGNHDQWDTLHSGFRIDRHSTPIDTLTLQGDVNEQNAREKNVGILGGISNGNAYTHGGNLLARWTHTPSERESTSLLISYTRQDEIVPPVGFNEADYNVEFQNRFPLGDMQEITWGLGARESQIRFDPFARSSFDPKSRSLYVINGFVQDQISIVPDRLQWYVGTKLEYNNLTEFEFEPSTRLAWTPDKQNTVWAAISRSSRIPSLYQDTRDNFGIITIDRSDARSEKTLSYELGYKVQPSKTVTVDATGFYNTYKGLIEDVATGPSPLNQAWMNAAAAQSAGAELALSWQVTPQWKLAGSYTFLDVIAERSGYGSARLSNASLQTIAGNSPENQFQIHSYFDLTKTLQLNASGYYVDSLPRIQGDPFRSQNVGAYFRLDLGATWKLRENMSLSVGVQNLLQHRHAESGGLGISLTPSEVPRSAYVQFEMKF